jgi:hypothetical protein
MPRRDDPLTYEAEMGKAPARLPDEHPDAWQWAYRGTKAERTELAETLGLGEQDAPVVIDGQEDLF